MASVMPSDSSDDDVVVLRWPDQRADAERLEHVDRPYLLLVEPGAAPPHIEGCIADWIRLPADDADVSARLIALSIRARRHPHSPQLDGLGEFTFRGQRVNLSPIDERITRLLVERFDRVVPDTEFFGQVWNSPDGHIRLRVHMSRLRKRLAPLGLEISAIRNVGYRMHLAEAPAHEHGGGAEHP